MIFSFHAKKSNHHFVVAVYLSINRSNDHGYPALSMSTRAFRVHPGNDLTRLELRSENNIVTKSGRRTPKPFSAHTRTPCAD